MREDLSAYLSTLYEPKERFKIDSMDKANWALRKILEAKGRVRECEDMATREIERVNEWLESVKSKEENEVAFFEGLLQEYFVALRLADEKLKTLTLPLGRIKAIKQQVDFVKESDALLEWSRKAAPELIERVEKVKWGELKKKLAVLDDGRAIFLETGEIIDGLKAVDRGEKIYVEVDSDETVSKADSGISSTGTHDSG